MKRLLITGASGYLGQRLTRAAGEWDVAATYFSRPVRMGRGQAFALDLREEAAVLAAFERVRPDAVLHTACSNRDADHIAAILPAARNVVAAARSVGARLVHVSTDLVFDGEHAPYHDDSLPAPINDYGRAKAGAEAIVAEVFPEAAIVRPSLIWGLDPVDRQTRWLVDGARSGPPVTLFTDEVRCPVFVDDLAAALLELAGRPEIVGVLNTGGPQALNRWDFGQRLLAALGIAGRGNVRPGTVGDSGLARARNLTLAPGRAARELRSRLRGVDEVLAALPAA
jgi:dTDP-4-dehydrorhamnose reductase